MTDLCPLSTSTCRCSQPSSSANAMSSSTPPGMVRNSGSHGLRHCLAPAASWPCHDSLMSEGTGNWLRSACHNQIPLASNSTAFSRIQPRRAAFVQPAARMPFDSGSGYVHSSRRPRPWRSSYRAKPGNAPRAPCRPKRVHPHPRGCAARGSDDGSPRHPAHRAHATDRAPEKTCAHRTSPAVRGFRSLPLCFPSKKVRDTHTGNRYGGTGKLASAKAIVKCPFKRDAPFWEAPLLSEYPVTLR